MGLVPILATGPEQFKIINCYLFLNSHLRTYSTEMKVYIKCTASFRDIIIKTLSTILAQTKEEELYPVDSFLHQAVMGIFTLTTSVLLLLFSDLNSKLEVNPDWSPEQNSSAHVRVVPRGALSTSSIFLLNHIKDIHGSSVKQVAGDLNSSLTADALYLAITPDLQITLTPHSNEGIHFVLVPLETNGADTHILSSQPAFLQTSQNGTNYYLHVCLSGYTRIHEGSFCLRPVEGRKGVNTIPLLVDTWIEHCVA